MEEADIIKDLLVDNWNSDNTGTITPVIDLIVNRSNVDVRANDFILIYNTGAGPVSHAGVRTFSHMWSVSIDLRTVLYTRYKLYIAEIKRIIEGKYLSPSNDYHRLYIIRDTDLSDKKRGMYRRVIDVQITQDLEEVIAI